MPYDPTMTDEQVVAAFLRRVKARQEADQREKRRAASRAAKASVSLEGFKVSAESAVQNVSMAAGKNMDINAATTFRFRRVETR